MLKISNDFFSALKEHSVNYCHWKSNEHLYAGLQGNTDLDILVERSSCTQLYHILNDLCFIRGKSSAYLSYSSIDDFIGFDTETGKLIHLHVHYELVIGKKFIKGVRLPWEKIVFKTTVQNESTYQIRTINPNIEIILLVLRNVLKKHSILKQPKLVFSTDENTEMRWLLKQVDGKKIYEYSCKLINVDFAEKLMGFLTSSTHKNNLSLYKSSLKYFIYQYNLSSTPVNLTYYCNKLQAAVRYLCFTKLHKPIPYRRTLPQGGYVITFVGVDGAGKSTLIKIINKWLSWKLDVYSLYFGSGQGKSSLLRLPIKLLAQYFVKRRGDVTEVSETESREKNTSVVKRFTKVVWAITLALEKKSKLSNMIKGRSKGLIVLTDRFPQTQTEGYNDGPLLGKWKASKVKLMKNIANWEQNIYNISNLHSPDMLLKLFIPAELAAQRKNDTPLFMLEKKIEVIKRMSYGEETEIIDIDSSKTPEETGLEIKKYIWRKLNGL